MPQRPGYGKFIGGIISCVIGAMNAIAFLTCLMVGLTFINGAEDAKITVNGVQLKGQEAADAARELGAGCLKAAGFTGFFAAGLVVLGIVLLKKYSKDKKAFQTAMMQQAPYLMNNMGQYPNMQQAPYGMPGQFPNMQQNPYGMSQNPYGNTMGQYPNMQGQNNTVPNSFMNNQR